MNTKVVIVLLDWPQFNATTTGLRLLRQDPTHNPVFTKPAPLGKRHIVVKVPWPTNYWFIDKDTYAKVSPTLVKSVASSLTVGNVNSKPDIASHWLPTAASLTILDPNQPKPLMKITVSIEQDPMQYHTSVLIDSTTTLNFASRDFLTRNNPVGTCIRGPKIVVRIANEQRMSTSETFLPANVSLSQKSSLVSALKFYHISNVWILSLIFQQ